MVKMMKKGAGASVLLSTLLLVGCNGGGSNPTGEFFKNVVVNYVNGDFIMSVALKGVELDAGITLPIDKLSNSTLEIGPDAASNGTLVKVTVEVGDMNNLLTGVVPMDPEVLPGPSKRPLPSVSTGVMPGYRFDVKALGGISLYASNSLKLFGLFIPVKMGLKDVIGTFRLYSGKSGVGTLSVVGSTQAGDPSGLLFLVRMGSNDPAGRKLAQALR